MFPNKPIDVKLTVTGEAVFLTPISGRAYTWARKELGADAPRGPDGQWRLRPDALDATLESLPDGWCVWRA